VTSNRTHIHSPIGTMSRARLSTDEKTGYPILTVETDHQIFEFHVRRVLGGADCAARLADDLTIAAEEFKQRCMELVKNPKLRLVDHAYLQNGDRK
jgi:hypothetical protein